MASSSCCSVGDEDGRSKSSTLTFCVLVAGLLALEISTLLLLWALEIFSLLKRTDQNDELEILILFVRQNEIHFPPYF